jgi:hypothetical protein
MRSVSVSGPLGALSPTMVAAPARWRPQLTLQQIQRNASPYLGVGPQGLKAVVADAEARTTARFFSSGLLPNLCGQPGMPPCTQGTPQSSLSGFRGVASMQIRPAGFGALGADVDAPKSRSTPGFCSPVRTLLSELEWLLDKVTYASDVVRQAQFVYNDLDANWAYVPGTGGCDRDAATLASTIAALRADMQRNGTPAPGGTSTLTPPEQTKPPEVDPMVKLAVIGGVAVAGIIGLAVITGNAASIIKVFR